MKELYTDLSFSISRIITRSYSTSFSIAVAFLGKELRDPIYSIYGFVRFADEIVDSFHQFGKEHLLEKFEADYYDAMRTGISINPVLHSFQTIVRKYSITDDLIRAFLDSMKADLHKKDYHTSSDLGAYIYGSAEVVGLMCLKVFCNNNETLYERLRLPAMKLGSAFQKVNFLRDMNSDMHHLGRRYFPDIVLKGFNEDIKQKIVRDIEYEFNDSYPGIRNLPSEARLGVLIAYRYYRRLLRKIAKIPADMLMQRRITVPAHRKVFLLIQACFENRLSMT